MNRILHLRTAVAFLCTATTLQPSVAQQASAGIASQIETLFAMWNTSTSPGCAYGVMRDGKVVNSGAYGMADMDRGAKLTTSTTFDVASIAKQFTAATVVLLSREGDLSLQDDVRRYIPELPDYGTPITIYHLLHHQSGIRDYTVLTYLAGTRAQRSLDNAAIVRLIAQQKALNFKPGENYLYSNSNYILLAEIVERVVRQPLPRLTSTRIFKPLEMNSTRFLTDGATRPVSMAVGYMQSADGSLYPAKDASTTYGDGHLGSSILDIARWDDNFYRGTVGGALLLDQMRIPGTLASGATTDYGLGLQFTQYRGHAVEIHGGTTDGFKTQLMRFPALHTSVAVFCNAPAANPDRLTTQIADIVLADRLAPQNSLPPPGEEVRIDPAIFDVFAGDYSVPTGNTTYVMTASRKGGQFFVQRPGTPPIEIFAASETEFFARLAPARFIFSRDAAGVVTGVSIVQSSGSREGTRIRSAPQKAARPLSQYMGTFRSDELEASVSVEVKGEQLVVIGPNGWTMVLEPRGDNRFALPVDGEITFGADQNSAVNGFSLSMTRARNLTFIKIQ